MNMINFQIQIFLLALTGFVLGKRKVLDARTRGHLTDLILMAALPCSIIDSFQMTGCIGYGIGCFTAMRALTGAFA